MAAKPINSDLTVDGQVSGTSLKGTGLTPGRVPVVGTGGLLTDASSLTFDGTTLAAPSHSGDGSKLTGAGVGPAGAVYAALNFGGL